MSGIVLHFNTTNLDFDDNVKTPLSSVHIRMQQRNGKKSLTTIEGLAKDLDLKKILKYIKKMHSTNGTIIKDEELGEIIQVQGDQRNNVYNFLINHNICQKKEVHVHGF